MIGLDPRARSDFDSNLRLRSNWMRRWFELLPTPRNPGHLLNRPGNGFVKCLPEFEANGVVLGLENYEEHSVSHSRSGPQPRQQMRWHLSRHVNSLAHWRHRSVLLETLAPLTVNLHVKDFVIERAPYKMGFVRARYPSRFGQARHSVVAEADAYRRHFDNFGNNGHLRRKSVEATITMERDWAERGVQYLRSCGCS